MNYKLVILTVFCFIGRALCDVDCSSFTSCQECSAQDQVCGWCADADGGGSCIHMTNTLQPVTPCPSGYWNYDCCSQHTSCDDCSKANEAHNCKWCESGSSVNGNKCIPYNKLLQPQLGGCDTKYYTNNCCGDYNTCDTCSEANSHINCRWCQTGSTVNGNKCIPYDSDLNPMWGGCDAEYYTNNCCGDYSTCDTCSEANSHINCKWCQTGSSVNGNKCIPYDGSSKPMWGGCDSDYYTNNCCDDYTTCDTCSKANSHLNCKWCQTGSTINGGRCVPYDGSSNPMWGGCNSEYYTNNCCDDYDTCDACAKGNEVRNCKWCQKGSKVNGGRCVPYDGSSNPMWGGCDADYYTNSCCQDMQTCQDCISKGWDCKWCGEASTVNPSECLPYNGSREPMYGGCDAGNFTNTCPANFISF